MSVPPPYDPFSTKSLLDLPELSTDASKTWSGFVFEVDLQSETLSLAPLDQLRAIEFQPDTLKLAIDHAPSLNLGFLEEPSETPDVKEERQDIVNIKQEVEDLWTLKELHEERHEIKLVSWDNFRDQAHKEPSCAFNSEAGPAAFDALLRKTRPQTHNSQTRYVKPNVFLGALFDLGLGRSSILFQWSEEGQRFESGIDNYTTSGLSRDVFNHIVVLFMDAGTRLRKLKAFARSHTGHSPTKIALKTALASVVHVLEDVIEVSRHNTRSLLQVQETFRLPFVLLQTLDMLSQKTRGVSDDSDLASAVLVFAEQVAIESPEFEQVTNSIVACTIQPSLERLSVEVGLLHSDQSQELSHELVSALLPHTTLKLFEQAKDALHVLRLTSAEHVLLAQRSQVHDTLSVECDPEAIVLAQQKAKNYENTVRGQILDSTPGLVKIQLTSNGQSSTEKSGGPFAFNSDLFEAVVEDLDVIKTGTKDSLRLQVQAALTANDNTSSPTIVSCRQAIDLSVNPVLAAQHRLLSYSVLQILFQDHGFVAHMDLLGRFELLCDGTFVSKISTALFDSEQVSGEGRRTTYAKTGLRPQSRETWPPASSELRLVLMGILSESMATIRDVTLTESVSFAIRDMSDEDLERCRDIDSIHALDFLRLNYKPFGAAIESIVTQKSLDSYDRVFNQLLRLLRIKVLTQSMLRHRTSRTVTNPAPRSSEYKFCVEAHRFISSLADFYHNTVIRSTWFEFTSDLRDMEASLSRDDYTGTLHRAPSLAYLRDLHERTLDTIVRGLLLKRRHAEIKGVIDRLFEVILRFAAAVVASRTRELLDSSTVNDSKDSKRRRRSAGVNESPIPQLHSDFQVHVKTLVRLLRTEVGRAEEGADVFEQLLLRLDWNGYWSRSGT